MVVMEQYEFEIECNCACGCGLPATQIFKQIPINEPACYATYMRIRREVAESRATKLSMQGSPLEHMSARGFLAFRREQTC
jgi:hypothetical protein